MMSVGRTQTEFITPIESWAQKQEIESCSSSDNSEQMNFLPFILRDEPQRTIPEVFPARLTNEHSIKKIICSLLMYIAWAVMAFVVGGLVGAAVAFSILFVIAVVIKMLPILLVCLVVLIVMALLSA